MITKRRLTVDDVVAMGDVGLLKPDERVELIDGDLYYMTPPSSRHAAWVDRLMKAFERAYGDLAIVRVQSPVMLSEHDSPEPDVALLRLRDDYYEAKLPQAADVLLAAEVSSSSLAYDTGVKLPLYARAGIPEVWIVNLEQEQLEVFREPQGGKYRRHLLLDFGESLRPLAFPEASEIVVG